MERRVTAEALHVARDARPSTVNDLRATGARPTGTVIDRRLTAGMRRVTTATWRDAVATRTIPSATCATQVSMGTTQVRGYV